MICQRFIRLFISVSLTLFVYACSGPAGSTVLQPPGALELSIRPPSVPRGLIQTIEPDGDTSVAGVRIQGSSAETAFDVSSFSPESPISVERLQPGIWTIDAEAFNAQNELLYTGSTIAVVDPGETTSATITLSPLPGEGTVSLSLDWPVGAVASPVIEATFAGDGPETVVDDPIFLIDKTAGRADSTVSAPAGYYRLAVALFDGEVPIWGEAHAVLVRTGFATSATLSVEGVTPFSTYVLSGSWYSLDSEDSFSFQPDGSGISLDPPGSSLYEAKFLPSDPFYLEQWNLQQLDMPAVWHRVQGVESVVVAVVDSGIDSELPDFAGVSVLPGWNLVDDNSDTSDPTGHGTHVAGTIAQATNNGYGTAGMAFGVSILPVRVLRDDMTSSHELIADGIRWATDHGADIINLSVGDPNASTPDGMEVVQNAVAYAADQGVLLIAAAGNNNDTVRYPAAYPEVMAVGALDYSGRRADYSNFGSELEIMAPGGGSPYTELGGGLIDAVLQQMHIDPGAVPARPHVSDEDFRYLAGTSQATPHVSAIAALLKSADPSLTAQDIRNAITETANDLGDPGRDPHYGFGEIDPVAALSFGTQTLHPVGAERTGGLGPVGADATWCIQADAGIVAVRLVQSSGTDAFDLRLFDPSGRLVAVGEPDGDGIMLDYDVKLNDGNHFLVVSRID